ncbi:hypothetical protein M0R45_030444 [Rubus argutus]|uniref:Uncharacterized protein n=1 Tax=Rubus argutus TaxID=59490 RepID=A0AAW1WB34_RUBAR
MVTTPMRPRVRRRSLWSGVDDQRWLRWQRTRAVGNVAGFETAMKMQQPSMGTRRFGEIEREQRWKGGVGLMVEL